MSSDQEPQGFTPRLPEPSASGGPVEGSITDIDTGGGPVSGNTAVPVAVTRQPERVVAAGVDQMRLNVVKALVAEAAMPDRPGEVTDRFVVLPASTLYEALGMTQGMDAPGGTSDPASA